MRSTVARATAAMIQNMFDVRFAAAATDAAGASRPIPHPWDANALFVINEAYTVMPIALEVLSVSSATPMPRPLSSCGSAAVAQSYSGE